MANWSPLREALASVDDRVTFAWSGLDDLVGGLPPSVYDHAAFWKGARTGWSGFTTVDVKVGHSVTFVRRTAGASAPPQRVIKSSSPRPPTDNVHADVVLVGCVKTKLDRPAPARDLYTSSLFRKERSYAEAAGVPWFVLSAQHGLVAPTTVVEPYDLRLSSMARDYRRAWGRRVVEQLKDAVGPLAGRVIEIHASSAYADAIRDHLGFEGAMVLDPLHGLPQGKRLAWYGQSGAATSSSARSEFLAAPDVPMLVERLGACASAIAPADFLATGGAGLRLPGLYSWWADQNGAATLTTGLRHTVDAGLIYGGLAGATRSRSGRKSTNTLWGRVRGMHLGGRHEFSTFRLSLGSILANVRNEAEIDEEYLTAWMHRHLRLIAVPVDDADALDGLETAVLADLDPPLNLKKMPRSPVRERLTELRRQYSRRSRSH